MTVSCYFGLTESGKSYHVENHVLPLWERKVIFDNALCFKGTHVLVNPSRKSVETVFKALAGFKAYSLVIKPDRASNVEKLFNMTVELSCALGRSLGRGVDSSKRVQLVCDEADFVCSPHYQSAQLKHLVNKGRHDGVDSHFIARNPMRIHTDIRANCTEITTFRLKNAGKSEFFREMFGDGNVRNIGFLKKYCRMYADETGAVSFVNEKNQKVAKISEILQKTQNFDENQGDL